MNDNNSIETVTRALEELKGKNYDRLTPEERIEWEFLTGLAIDFSSVTTEAYDNIAKAIPYVERALENLRKYPLEERLHLEKICHDELSDLYMLCKDKRAEEQIGQCIDLHRKWLGDGRPLRAAPPRHDGLHDARLCQNGIPARPDLPR